MNATPPTGTRGRRPILTAALTVATAAGVATAHGLYQVALASRVPTPVAWLYPVITDGLALVAYASTARLHDRGRRYAAVMVVLAAGLSGLAQAVYLAGGRRRPHRGRDGVDTYASTGAERKRDQPGHRPAVQPGERSAVQPDW